MLASLDGYAADEEGEFGWAQPDEEVHRFVNDLARPVGTHLYGRRMYEAMKVWESGEVIAGEPAEVREFAEIWRPAEKIVYSRTLEDVSTERTRIERDFDPETVRRMKDEADRDLSVSGPTLAAEAFHAGLIDECQLFLAPAIVGAGTRALPDGLRLDLELLDEQRFGNGFVHLRYRVGAAGPAA